MRKKITILSTLLLLAGVFSLDAKTLEGNTEEKNQISSNVESNLQITETIYKAKKNKKDNARSKSNKSLAKNEITGADLNIVDDTDEISLGSINSPSNRKNHEWDDGIYENDIFEKTNALSAALEVKKEYKSAIAKIKEAEENLKLEEKKLAWISNIKSDDYMEIFISGGGYKNGVDARLHDRIMINNAGYIESYYESEISGVKKTVKTVKKEDLAEFVKWIAEKGFFDFKKEYDCYTTDAECKSRLNRRPQPIPLKIVVAVGQRRNVVVVPIFSPNIEKNYIEYPKELIQIVEAIYLFASL